MPLDNHLCCWRMALFLKWLFSCDTYTNWPMNMRHLKIIFIYAWNLLILLVDIWYLSLYCIFGGSSCRWLNHWIYQIFSKRKHAGIFFSYVQLWMSDNDYMFKHIYFTFGCCCFFSIKFFSVFFHQFFIYFSYYYCYLSLPLWFLPAIRCEIIVLIIFL